MDASDRADLNQLHAAAWELAARAIKDRYHDKWDGPNGTASAHTMMLLAELAEAVSQGYSIMAKAQSIIADK